MLIDCINYKWNHIILKDAMRSVIRNQMNILRAIVLAVLVGMAAVCRAEVIGGKVEDETEKSAEGIAVVALQLPDSVYMGGTVTDSTGVFRIETKAMPAKFLLRAEGIGYEKTLTEGHIGLDNKIVVTHGGIALEEVSVTARPRTEVTAGKFTFYPGELVNKVNDAFAVLKYAPLLEVSDFKDGISIVGLGAAKILINGKNSIMSSQAIVQMLRASDGPRVKRVEIWVNPPVDRIGEGPIVNLVLAPRTGSMGSTDLSVYYDNYVSGRWQGWYGGEWDDWQVSLDMSVHRNVTKSTTYRDYKAYKVSSDEAYSEDTGDLDFWKTSDYKSKQKSYSLFASAGVSKDFHHDNSLGLTVRVSAEQRDDMSSDYTTYLTGQPSEEMHGKVKGSFRPNRVLARLNYDQNLDSAGSNLYVWVAYSGLFHKSDNTFLPLDVMQGYRADNNSSSVELNGQWTKYYNGQLSSTVGISGFYDHIANKMFYSPDGSLSGALSLDDNLRQRQTSADIFGGIRYEFSRLLTVNAGLRGRWYERKIEQFVQSVSRKFNDFYLLPNVTMSLNFNTDNMLSAGYSMTVEQPRYYNTNPIRHWFSPNDVSSGNPDLKAVTAHNITLYYILMQKISMGGTATLKNNVAVRGSMPLADGVTLYAPLEAGKTRDYKLFAGYNNSFLNYRWRVYGRVEWTLARMENNLLPRTLADGAESDSQWNAYLSSSWTLGNDRSWEIGLTGNYQSERHLTFNNVKGWVDFGFYFCKNFSFGGRLWISADNLLNHKFSSWYDCEAYSSSSRSLQNSRFFMVKFDINFGKQFRMRSNSSRDNFQSR